MRVEIYSSMSPMSMITIDLLIRNISMPIRADRGREEKEEEEGRGSQIIVSRRVKVKWLSRGTIDAEGKVVVFEAYDSSRCTLLNGLMVIYREGIDGLFVCLSLPTPNRGARTLSTSQLNDYIGSARVISRGFLIVLIFL